MATKPVALPAAVEEVPDRYEGLEARVAHLENVIERMVTGKVAEISQEERDRQVLSRRPNSYPEAVEYEAARQRQAERDKDRPEGEKADPATAQPSTPPSGQPPVPVG